ncbi:MAG: CRTAC1 family protein [Terriglobia bacterium]
MRKLLLVLLLLPPTRAAEAVHFTDVTSAAGIKFTHNAGRTGKKWLPETMGPGCAFFDADGDGWLDILILNGRDLIPHGRRTPAALYRNNHDGTFTDIAKSSGLDIDIYGMGVTIGDYDNDGREDVYITALGGDHLFHNEGGGHFRDVTRESAIANNAFSTSALWFDYDRDGKLDLFVANYVQWSQQSDVRCSLDGATKSYCTPESYKGAASKLYHNLGNGKFQDVTVAAGLSDPTSKSLGVASIDFNNDGWPDLFVANDTQPNKLYRNLQNGTFKEEGLAAGLALGEDGTARGAMGVDAGDYDRSGRQHLAVGNFSSQMIALYHNDGKGLFVDEAAHSPIARASLNSLTFGLFFFDYDLDGYPDLFAANGHLEEQISRVQPKIQYEELPLLFHNAAGKFQPVPAFAKPLVARGAAYGDFDRDGDLDILIATNNGPAYLYRNDGGNRNHWLQIRLNGVRSNRDGIGAVVRVGPQMQTVHSGSSYCSASDLALTFGLGADAGPQTVEIQWPSGTRQKMTGVKPDQRIVIGEQ